MELFDKNLLVTGKIRTSYGVKGYMKILSYSGELKHFSKLETVIIRLDNREFRKKIEDVRVSSKDLLIKFEGINTPEEAREFINFEILIPRENAVKCGSGEFYIADLNGCVLCREGIDYGTVISVITNSASDLLEVEAPELTEKGKKNIFLVPFRKEFIGEVDIDNKKIELFADWIIE